MNNTVLHCSDYRCTRTNIETFRDDRGWDGKGSKVGAPTPSLKNILCRLHAGALKRSTYRDNPLALFPNDIRRLLAEQAALDEQARVEAGEQAIQREANDVKRHAEEWEYTEAGAHHGLRLEKDTWRTDDEPEPIYSGHVWSGEEDENDRYDSRWFQIEPSVKHYGGKAKRKYPYYIRVTRGASLNSHEARELAAALLEGADKADELNVERKP